MVMLTSRVIPTVLSLLLPFHKPPYMLHCLLSLYCSLLLFLSSAMAMILGKRVNDRSFLVIYYKQPTPGFVTAACHNRIFPAKSPSLGPKEALNRSWTKWQSECLRRKL